MMELKATIESEREQRQTVESEKEQMEREFRSIRTTLEPEEQEL
jgi:hypothetical protein